MLAVDAQESTLQAIEDGWITTTLNQCWFDASPYVADLLARWLRGPARIARPLVERLPSSSRKVSLEFKAKRFVRGAGLPTLERHLAWKQLLSPDARAEILARSDGHSDPLDLYRRRYAETAGAETLARLQDVDLGIYLVDDQFRFAHVNPVAAPVFGPEPVVGEDFDQVIHRLWPREYTDEITRRFRHTLATGEPHHVPEKIETRSDRLGQVYRAKVRILEGEERFQPGTEGDVYVVSEPEPPETASR